MGREDGGDRQPNREINGEMVRVNSEMLKTSRVTATLGRGREREADLV